ncbi:MAG: hypothetical protein V3V14_03990 [Saprospiraceae bacterium]
MIVQLNELHDTSKIWIYQADNMLTDHQVTTANKHIHDFLVEWTAHQNELKCYGDIFYNRYLVLIVDESSFASASGCSIDSSNRFVQQIGSQLGVEFFNRMLYTYISENEVKTVHHSELAEAYAAGEVNDDTMFFDNLVKTKQAFVDDWLVPLKNSWHYRFT